MRLKCIMKRLYGIKCLSCSPLQLNKKIIWKLGLFHVQYFITTSLRNLKSGWVWWEVVDIALPYARNLLANAGK